MKEIFQNGGFIMYILLGASIIAFSIVLEKIFYYFLNEKGIKTKLDFSGKFGNKNSVNKLLKMLTDEKNKNEKIDYLQLEEKAREFVLATSMKLEDKLWILGLTSNLSTLLGLFGTVIGMIAGFEVIAVAGTGDPKVLADSIAKALITTAGGLSVAMPTTVFLNYFTKKSEYILTLMEKVTVEYLNTLRSEENEK